MQHTALGPEQASFRVLLQRYRAAAGLSQEELAERAGLSRRGISDLERGQRRSPHPATVRRLAEALNLGLAERAILLAGASAGAMSPSLTVAPAHADPGEPSNLPVQLTSFIGREQECEQIQRLLSTTRLLTVTGPGGIGKTRLALQVATHQIDAYPDGVWLVELAGLVDSAFLAQTVATTLRMREEPGRPLPEHLVDVLEHRHMLVVFDNCEHLVAGCAALVHHLLGRCAGLHVLVTSREPLGLTGEQVHRLGSMAHADAVQLFVERAAAHGEFALTEQSAAVVDEVCRRLDGIPLAIELAAARVTALSVAEIAARLHDRFRLLVRGSRAAAPRQHTLLAALDWSYGLLGEPERRLFDGLCVFSGGYSIEAAEAVCAGHGLASDQILDLLAQLVDKSLVLAEPTPSGRMRYRLLETLRAFGLEHLEAQGDLGRLQARHAAFYVDVAEQAAMALVGPDQASWLDHLEQEHDNLRAALRWAYERREAAIGTRLAGALGRFWSVRGHLTEGRQWAEAFLVLGTHSADVEGCAHRTKVHHIASGLAMAQGDLTAALAFAAEGLALARTWGNQREEARGLLLLGHVARLQGHFDRAATLLEQSLALQRAAADPWGIAGALEALAVLAGWQGEDDRAAALHTESLALFRSVGDIRATAVALYWLGELACRRGEYVRALSMHEESLALMRSLGDERSVAYSLAALGDVALAEGAWQQAARRYRDGLELFRRLGDRDGVRRSVHGLACTAAHGSRPERAARLLGAAEALAETLGVAPRAAEQREHARGVSAVQRRLSHATLAAAWAEGRALSPEQALAEALTIRVDPEPLPAVATPHLSRREQEVAALVARGFTNRQIAQALVISGRTAETHLERIYSKLQVHSRAQLAAWLAEHDRIATV